MVEREAAKRAIIYNPNLSYDENKYLNDYMGKEMPGKVTSKYGDVKTYRYADVVDNNKNTSVSKTPVINKSGASQGINNTTKIASQNPNTSMANQNQISNVTVGTNKSLNIKQREGQNPQQWQRSRDSLAQNNKNSINKTQPQGNQDYSGNQQVSKGATSNKQQGAPVSKTSVINDKSSVVALDVTQRDTNKLKSINLSKLKVVKNSTPKEANLFWREKAGYTNDPYDENYEVKLVKNNGESFVRVYTASKTNKASAWFMREEDIIGLTPEEIKDKFALPYTPTHVVNVKIGNITIRTGIVKEVESWGKGKGQQFDTNGTRLNEEQFVNEREIGERYERK